MKLLLFLALLCCCNALIGTLKNAVAGFLNAVTKNGGEIDSSVNGTAPTQEEIIAELRELNSILKENVNSLKQMVSFHKSSAIEYKNEASKMRREYADNLNAIQKNYDNTLAEMKKRMSIAEDNHSKQLAEALNEFEREKQQLIRAMKETHAKDIRDIRNELRNQIVDAKSSAASVIRDLSEKLDVGHNLLTAKSKEVEEHKRTALAKSKEIEEIRRALSTSSSSVTLGESSMTHKVIKSVNSANVTKPIIQSTDANERFKYAVLETNSKGDSESSFEMEPVRQSGKSRNEKSIKSRGVPLTKAISPVSRF